MEDLYSETLNNEAVLHKSCSLLYNNKILNQKRKSYDKPSQNQSANIDGDTLEIPEKQPMRTSIIEKLCFFCGCGKSAEESSWHHCQPTTKWRRLLKNLQTTNYSQCRISTTLTACSTITGKAISKQSTMSGQAEGSTIFKAAKIIRKYMFETDEVFDGDFSECQLKVTPSHLLLVLGLILEGSKVLKISTATVALKLSELVHLTL